MKVEKKHRLPLVSSSLALIFLWGGGYSEVIVIIPLSCL